MPNSGFFVMVVAEPTRGNMPPIRQLTGDYRADHDWATIGASITCELLAHWQRAHLSLERL